MRGSVNSYLSKTANGICFDGIFQGACIGQNITGYIFGATPRFADGDWVETSEVVWVSNILSCGWYAETKTGSRYLLSSVEYNPTLPESSRSVEAAMEQKRKHIMMNEQYFRPLIWSAGS